MLDPVVVSFPWYEQDGLLICAVSSDAVTRVLMISPSCSHRLLLSCVLRGLAASLVSSCLATCGLQIGLQGRFLTSRLPSF
jgi:hypothetical protein